MSVKINLKQFSSPSPSIETPIKNSHFWGGSFTFHPIIFKLLFLKTLVRYPSTACLLYTSDAADE